MNIFPIYLSVRRRVLVLAATLWQHVLPPRRSAPLHDPADDEWVFESQGKFVCMCVRGLPQGLSLALGFCFDVLLPFPPPPFLLMFPFLFLCVSFMLFFVCLPCSSVEVTLRVGQRCTLF